MTDTTPEYRKAQRHLARSDEVMERLIALVGPCRLQVDPNGFAMLVRSIIAQQISTKAAVAIGARLKEALKPKRLSPAGILSVSDEVLRSAGLSANKARSLRDLAEKVHSREVPLHDFAGWPDENVIAHLLPVRGIGRWTAEMFLIFSLGRLDVFPIGDLGVRTGIQRQYAFAELPERGRLIDLAECWRPYRTVATWYLWRSLGFVPQSGMDPARKQGG